VRVLVFLLALVAAPPGNADVRPAAPLRFTLDTLPEKDFWVGLAFGDAKVGYAHVSIQQVSGGLYEIRGETVMVLRMLGFEKSIEMRSRDLVRPDLALVEFDSEQVMDGNRLRVSGRVEGSRLVTSLENAGTVIARDLPHQEGLVPASAIGLIPLLEGVEPGRRYRRLAFSPESLRIARVEQRVEVDTSVEHAAFAVHSSMEGQDGVTWLDGVGRFVAETALDGSLRATPQTANDAKAFVRAARESAHDVIVGLSLVKIDRALALPRQATRMRVVLEGVPIDLPSVGGQRCTRAADTWACEIEASQQGSPEPDPSAWLRPSFTVPSRDPEIERLSHDITAGAKTPEAKARAILGWLGANIRRVAADGFSARDVLATRRGECHGHSYLFAALARAAGLPTRVLNGLVYSEAHQGFLYHTWTETLIEGRWREMDPTFGQPQADATHIRILDGEDYADIAPMMGLVGRVRARVVAYESGT
jgi:hypothetical protein